MKTIIVKKRGQPLKYNEKTVQLVINVPKSKLEECKNLVKEHIKKYLR